MQPISYLKKYDQNHLGKISLPIGGIGTGTIGLGGRGDLRDWEIGNRPSKGFIPTLEHIGPFFAIRTQDAQGAVNCKVLEGPLEPDVLEYSMGAKCPNHGLPRFRQAQFECTYPFGKVSLADKTFPATVALEAFNPFIPGDSEGSGKPIAVLRYSVSNPTDDALEVSICGSIPNFIGTNTESRRQGITQTWEYSGPDKGKNHIRTNDELTGILFESTGVDKDDEYWGTLAMSSPVEKGTSFSHRTSWMDIGWGQKLLEFWDDFSLDGEVEDRELGESVNCPIGSLCLKRQLAPGETRDFTFYLNWHFPNRDGWGTARLLAAEELMDGLLDKEGCPPENALPSKRVGNYYCTQYQDAWDAAEKISRDIVELERRTRAFADTFSQSTLPEEVLEAALFNIAHLRTQTVFRTEDGMLYAYEGCNENEGCCEGNCTNVWNYETTTAFFFGDLARKMREIEFGPMMAPDGRQSFRVSLPAEYPKWNVASADGQCGTLLKLYREWQLSGDSDFLAKLWPQARKALEFAWLPGCWDADADGVMEGVQNNTLDTEYFGPNPLMAFWYLAALQACTRMAAAMNDDELSEKCQSLYDNGSAWIRDNLFNGEYYEQHFVPQESAEGIYDSLLLHIKLNNLDIKAPEFQIGKGCLVDQLVGQLHAHVVGFGHLVDEDQCTRTLKSVFKYNFREELWDHFNHVRTYAANDESALLMTTWPHGERPKFPYMYHNEVMTGFEYAAATHMLFEGLEDEGLRCIRAIRSRYDGMKRSPFDEAEAGHHYARSMCAWNGVLALTGFRYSAIDQCIAFLNRPGVYFWTNGSAWGSVEIRDGSISINVSEGEISFQRYALLSKATEANSAASWIELSKPVKLTASQSWNSQDA